MFSFQPTQQAAPVVQQQPQQSVQQLIQNTAVLVKSLSGPEIFNDDRNEVVAKLNQLLAAFGVGQGYYKHDQQPINYDEKNNFYRFKGVVYNRMCRNTDEDGIVVLLLEVPIDQVNTDDKKLRIAEQLNNIFGMNAGVKTTVIGVKSADQQLTEVIINAYEQNKGRVPAMNLFKFLNQPDKMNSLRTILKCKKVFPLVALTKADREKFLNSPPDGFDPNLWRQGVRSNPDQERFVPQPIYGFEKLCERKRMQEVTNAVQSTVLNGQVERLKKLESEISRFKSHLQNNKRHGRELLHRLLRLAIYLAQDLRQGYALNKVEDQILAQTERSSVNLIGPDALKDRINGILKLIETDRQKLSDYFREIDTNLNAEEQLLLKQKLQTAQTQLEQITDNLVIGRKAVEILEQKR